MAASEGPSVTRRFVPAVVVWSLGTLASLELAATAVRSGVGWVYGVAVGVAAVGTVLALGLSQQHRRARRISIAILVGVGLLASLFAYFSTFGFGLGPFWAEAVAVGIVLAATAFGTVALLWRAPDARP